MGIINIGKAAAGDNIEVQIRKALSSPAEMERVCGDIMDKTKAAYTAYTEAVDEFYASVKQDREARADRRRVISQEKEALEVQKAEAETRLGTALVEGDAEGEQKAEKEIQTFLEKIRAIEDRLRIFDHAEVPLGSEKLFQAAMGKLDLLEKAMDVYGRFWGDFLPEYWDQQKAFEKASKIGMPEYIWDGKERKYDFRYQARGYMYPAKGFGYDPAKVREAHSGKKADSTNMREAR